MNVIFACGGTGGHINPAIAVANIWKERYPDSNILFVGGEGGLEQQLVPQAGYELFAVPADGFDRRMSLKGICNNFKAVAGNFRSVRMCKKLIREFKPDVIVGTGGYASFPALMAGIMMKVPTCVHEANAYPGMTTKLVARWVDRVLVCFPESAKYYKDPEKVEVVGMPVKREFIYTKKEDARRELGLDDRPVVASAFGSQGAENMNWEIGKLFKLEQDAGFPFQHIHAVGSYGWRWMDCYVRDQGVEPDTADAIRMTEYIYNMPTVMAAADIFISRAGAASCNEIAVSGTPCILIPSPNVTNNHQQVNAQAYVDKGAAVMVLQKECTAQRLMEEINGLLNDKQRYSDMCKALQEIAIPDCAERVCRIMEKLAKH